MQPTDPCPDCQATTTRPDIVWFGEIPYGMDRIADHLTQADIFVAIGTSGEVYPAAGFVEEARRFGAETLEINLEKSVSRGFDRHLGGPATRAVPQWVDSLSG